MQQLLKKIRKTLNDKKNRRQASRVVSSLCCVIVFVTTYAMVLPAITMEQQAQCGIEAHQHYDSCYELQPVCGLEESADHAHTDACYEKVLICGKEAHVHSKACYTDAGKEMLDEVFTAAQDMEQVSAEEAMGAAGGSSETQTANTPAVASGDAQSAGADSAISGAQGTDPAFSDAQGTDPAFSDVQGTDAAAESTQGADGTSGNAQGASNSGTASPSSEETAEGTNSDPAGNSAAGDFDEVAPVQPGQADSATDINGNTGEYASEDKSGEAGATDAADTAEISAPAQDAGAGTGAAAEDTNMTEAQEAAAMSEDMPALIFEDTILIQTATATAKQADAETATDAQTGAENQTDAQNQAGTEQAGPENQTDAGISPAQDLLPAETNVTVHVEAEEGTFPAGTSMVLATVQEEALDKVAEAVSNSVEGTSHSFQAVDISFRDASGNEIEPAKPVRVTMTSDAIKTASETPEIAEPVVLHMVDEGAAEKIEQTDLMSASDAANSTAADESAAFENAETADENLNVSPDTVSFDSDQFSTYVIVYTVDFHWEVNGKEFEFSIPGGGYVSFYDLVEGLGVEVNDADTEKDEIQELVDGVANIEFSNQELVSVSKVEEDSTVGAIKERLGLDCEYSAKLSEEEIAEINAQTVKAGDWALISVHPFTSEEKLLVTMKNGDQFAVKVTDAQISSLFITSSGETYEVTVTYGPEAKIPEKSRVVVTELSENSRDFQSAWKMLTGSAYLQNQSETKAKDDITLGMKAFDISIVDEGGNLVEPQSSVKVSFTLKSIPENVEEEVLQSTLTMQHVNESNGNAVIEKVAAIDGTSGEMELTESSMKAEFTVDSFSTYVITWGSATNTSTQLQIRNSNRTRATVPVYYVDTDGNPIKRPSTIGDILTANASSFPYTYTTDNLAKEISGYTYQGAHADNYRGSEINSILVTSYTSGYSWNQTTNYTVSPTSLYLVYSGQPSGITVHYGYMKGDTFVEFTNEEDGDVPAGTTIPKPSKYGDQWDLEKTIPGYRYVTSRLKDPKTGREISPLLNTDPPYVANVNNTFENADLSSYPDYTSSTAPTSFVSEWRYRQLSSIDWNPTDHGWDYSSSEHVTANGVTKPVSFAESDKDIYVIYEKGNMNGGSGSSDDTDLGELNAPKTDKKVDSNKDGTYDVTLSAKGEKRDEESSTKANVVIVLDTSWSMYEKDAGNGQSRLKVAKSAIGSLADKLFALNAEESDTIELAFVTFAQRVRNEEEMRTIYSGTNATSFKNMISGLECAEGTNWDDALYAANHIYFNDDDPTYIVFVTDGDPISCAHPYGTYNDWDGGTYYNKRSNYEYALAAKNQADLIIGNKKTLYTIGAFGDISNLQAIGGTYLGQANDTTTINGYFDDIISDIQSALGYQDITINDGITALSSTGLARGDITSLRYYRSGGKNANGSEKYDHTANDGHGVEWKDAPDAYLLEVKSEDGTTKYYKNGTAVSLTSLTDLTEAEFLEKYPVGTRTVIWDINAGSEDLLEDSVTYTMIFTMWPSQEAYDMIADLNNGTIDYDNDLSQAEKDQVFLGDDNVYYLKTNTKATVDYTSVKLVNGEVSGTPTSGSAPIEDPKGKMNLDTSIMTVCKEFAHLINEADPYEEIVFYLLVDGKYYNKDGTLSDTLDESKVYAINLPKDGKWEDTIYIAPGLMRGGEILETGHNYSIEEKIVSGNPYEYEFAPQTVRPMVITAVPTFLVEKDTFNTNQDNKKEYTFNDAESSYEEAEGKSDANGTYYVASENNGSLVGVNHKTSELDITKIISDPDNRISDAQEASDTFTYRVTLQIPDGSDPSGIVGYEYVPRTQSNAFTLFGYQTGQSAFAEDIERFNEKTFRAWNTLVYDALIEYDRITENGRTFIKAKRDDDGKII